MCQDGVCRKNCRDACAKAGETQCEQQNVQVCRAQSTGCLGWETTQTCTAQQQCNQGQCVEINKPKQPDGANCSGDADCVSGRCVAVVSAKICVRSCVGHMDCAKVPGQPFCRDGVCQPVPQGACLTAEHCGASESCLQQQCQQEPKTTGCQCSVSSEVGSERMVFWLVCWLACWLIFLIVRGVLANE